MKLRLCLVVVLIVLASTTTLLAAPQEPKEPGAAVAVVPRLQDGEPKPYDSVITADAKSSKGVFTVHWVKNKIYYEIPASELGKDFLWATKIAKNTAGGWAGAPSGNTIVRWEKRDNRILLRVISYRSIADEKSPVAKAVAASNTNAIMAAFNIEAYGRDRSCVVDVTKLFSTEMTEFSIRERLKARGFDPTRSFIDRITAYPQNIETEATHTYTAPPDAPTGTLGRGPGHAVGSATVVMHYSMIKLPENPMRPRLGDGRVGLFAGGPVDYGQDDRKAVPLGYVSRWRLEKKDPNAEVSEPVQPIVFYIDPATPERWRPWVKKGIEDWQPVFEAAGFKNAIIAKDPPTPEEDPNWSPEDVRHSMVRWTLDRTEGGANTGRTTDPRTGELLNSVIMLYSNTVRRFEQTYFVQAAPLDPRAQRLPLPDDMGGRYMEFVVSHEVGHGIGLMHNMKSSSLYPAAKLRDKEWVHTMGHVASVMDYSFFNYVAQPEDHIDPADLIQRIGPYDKWLVMWGYKPIPGAKTPQEEKKTLDEWSRQQDTTPWFRFSAAGWWASSDPGDNVFAVGDADAVYSTGLGLKNLRRVMELLPGAVTKPGEPYDDLNAVYDRIMTQWIYELKHVAGIVGGVETQEKYAGQEGVIYVPVAKQRQEAAMTFLNQNAFQTPTFLIREDVLRRLEPVGEMERISKAQNEVLSRLLENTRLLRLIEFEAADGAKAYHPLEFLASMRKGIWSELAATDVKIDAYRRNLQRSYVEMLGQKINARTPGTEQVRPYFSDELRTLNAEVGKALTRVTDGGTRVHLLDIRAQITKSLDPKFAQAAAARPGPAAMAADSVVTGDDDPLGCGDGDVKRRIPDQQY